MKVSTVIVGDSICGGAEDEDVPLINGARHEIYLRGYNTYAGHNPSLSALSLHGAGEIVSAVSGEVEITERVVSVKGQNPRYIPDVGDVVIGRVVEITGNRWLLDIHASQLGIMLLSNVTEPGGMLRRRNRGDELGMRAIFDEDDLVIAEVQRVTADGVTFLHTRAAEKYGKVQNNGIYVSVPPYLMRRGKRQFVIFDEYHCQLVMGMNGNIWISPVWNVTETNLDSNTNNNNNTDSKAIAATADEEEETSVQVKESEAIRYNSNDNDNNVDRSFEGRQYMVRVANCVKALASLKEAISASTVQFAIATTIEAGLNEFEITLPYAHRLLQSQLRLLEQQATF